MTNQKEEYLADDREQSATDTFSGAASKPLDFRKICQNLFEGIHITDGEGKILFVNMAYTRTTGIFPEQVIGHNIHELEGELYRGSVSERVIKTRKQVDSIAHVNGLDKDVLVTGLPIFDEDGNVEYVVTNTRDIGWIEDLKKRLKKQSMDVEDSHRNERAELAYLRGKQADKKTFICKSQKMQEVLDLIDNVAKNDITVLISGESGTGKEMICDRIYSISKRKDKPFIKVNCAAIPGELLESELFGYEEGAFTDARKGGKAGLFELADGGVIFLDEIGDMPLALQTKLLRVLQEKQVTRVGGTKPINLDVRIIAASNKDLYQEVQKGNFRNDLFYRLNVLPISLPALRERKEEIPYFVMEFIAKSNKKYNKHAVIDQPAMDLLTEYSWPGNIRELENLIERFVVICSDGIISRSMVASSIGYAEPSAERTENFEENEEGEGETLRERMGNYEKRLLLEALSRYPSKRKTAQALGINHATLLQKCTKYGIK